MNRSLLLLLGLACTCAAQADPVADLTAKLKTLRADVPLKGVLQADYQQFDATGTADKTKSAHLQLDFDSSDGLSIHLSPAFLQSLSAEEARNVADPDSPTPEADLLRQMSVAHLQHVLSAADGLLRLMDGASSPVSRPATLDGVAVTELDMSLPFKAPKKDADAAKDYQDGLSVWLDAQGVPLRFLEKVHAKFCKFFLCVTVDESYGGDLQVVSGRLVNVDFSQEHRQSGLGQDSHTKTVSTLTLR
ncbi:MAG TPA: hypothetical protein VLV87_08405 [Gammaproteobacteria bacterium]|nr:hypothetical protein [Gammaproteobacteria bacterium]